MVIMVQSFIVVRCYSCNVFQVHQSKKVSKFVCKMCYEKQSVKKVLFRGSGAECRRCVQELNMRMASSSDLARHRAVDTECSEYEDNDGYVDADGVVQHEMTEQSSSALSRSACGLAAASPRPMKSKWQCYMEEGEREDCRQVPDFNCSGSASVTAREKRGSAKPVSKWQCYLEEEDTSRQYQDLTDTGLARSSVSDPGTAGRHCVAERRAKLGEDHGYPGGWGDWEAAGHSGTASAAGSTCAGNAATGGCQADAQRHQPSSSWRHHAPSERHRTAVDYAPAESGKLPRSDCGDRDARRQRNSLDCAAPDTDSLPRSVSSGYGGHTADQSPAAKRQWRRSEHHVDGGGEGYSGPSVERRASSQSTAAVRSLIHRTPAEGVLAQTKTPCEENVSSSGIQRPVTSLTMSTHHGKHVPLSDGRLPTSQQACQWESGPSTGIDRQPLGNLQLHAASSSQGIDQCSDEPELQACSQSLAAHRQRYAPALGGEAAKIPSGTSDSHRGRCDRTVEARGVRDGRTGSTTNSGVIASVLKNVRMRHDQSSSRWSSSNNSSINSSSSSSSNGTVGGRDVRPTTGYRQGSASPSSLSSPAGSVVQCDALEKLPNLPCSSTALATVPGTAPAAYSGMQTRTGGGGGGGGGRSLFSVADDADDEDWLL